MTGPAPAIYGTDLEFFELFLGELFARPKRFRWCLQWQDHAEALLVVKVLHDSYEQTMSIMPTELPVWLRDFAYPLFMDRLCAENGTFADCDWQNETHELPLPLRSI